MHKSLRAIEAYVDEQRTAGTLRHLAAGYPAIDFCSNDYLGFARDPEIHQYLLQLLHTQPELLSGSTGSRLISGNSAFALETEQYIATQHQYASALLFPSGYMANLALWSTIAKKGDTLILDEYIHRSVHDGCRLSAAHRWKFWHNDCNDLEAKLKRAAGNCYVAVESLYSMDGDFAPLQEMAALCARYGAALLVDEAHAMGVFGLGLVHQYQLQEQVMATTITYGKAMGGHGAAILCPEPLKQYLVHKASPFIYSTATPDIQWATIKAAYILLPQRTQAVKQLQQNIQLWRNYDFPHLAREGSPIQGLLYPGAARIKALQQHLYAQDLHCYAICSPTVAQGSERLRICLHSYNSNEELQLLADSIQTFI